MSADTTCLQRGVTLLPPQPAEKAYAAYDELTLEIPSPGIKIPIVGVPQTGDGWDVSWLGNAVCSLEGSAFPTWPGNTVLTAHLWNADNIPGIFAGIKNLKYGNHFSIQAYGRTCVYEVRENTRLWGSSVSKVFKHEEYDWVTLLPVKATTLLRAGIASAAWCAPSWWKSNRKFACQNTFLA